MHACAMSCPQGNGRRNSKHPLSAARRKNAGFRSLFALHGLLVASLVVSPLALSAQTAHFAGVRSVVDSLATYSAEPQFVVVDPSGNLYIEDVDGSVLVKDTLQPDGTYVQSNITPNSDGLNPFTVDTLGNVYVPTTNSFSSATTLNLLTPSGGTYVQSVIPTGLTNEEYVKGIAVDAAGDVYIAAVGSSSSRVLKETLSGSSYSESVIITGLDGNIFSLALDPAGDLYMTDSATVIEEVYAAGSYTQSTIITGLGGSGDGITVDAAGNVYIAEVNGSVVYKETLSGGTYTQTVADGGFLAPGGVAIDAAGTLYVAETGSYSTYKESAGGVDFGVENVGSTHAPFTLRFLFDSGGVMDAPAVLTLGASALDFAASTGSCVTNGTNHTYSAGDVCTANVTFAPGVAGSRSGAVELVNGTGAFAVGKVWGTGVAPLAGFDAGTINTVPFTLQTASSAVLNGVAVDGNGNIYVTDGAACIVEKLTIATGTTATIAGTGTCGYSGDGGLATSAQFHAPQHVVVGGSGDVYISDSFNAVVRKVDALTGKVSVFAGIAGSSAYSGSGIPATSATLNDPTGLFLDKAGNLYIADSPKLVRRVDANTGLITTVAGTVGSAAGYGGDGGVATSSLLNGPSGLAMDGAGNLFIADTNNKVIREVSATTGFISTYAGQHIDICTDAGDGGAATSANLCHPQGVSVDAAGNLYIADTSNDVVRKVNVSNGLISAAAGVFNNGTSADSGAGGSAKLAGLGLQKDVTIDGGGNLYLVDQSNRVVWKVAQSQGTASFGSTQVGNSSTAIDVAIANNGNAELDLSALTASTNFNLNGADTTCSTSTALTAGATCILGIKLAPTTGGSLAGTVTVTNNGNNTSSTTQIATNGTGVALPAVKTVVSGVAATVYAGGTLGTVTVLLEDTNGNVASSTTASVTLTITGPGSYSHAVTVTSVNGVATFNLSAVQLSTLGAYTVTATSSGLTSSSANTTVIAAPSKTALSTIAANILAGGNLGTVSVSIESSNGQVVTASTAAVTITVTGPISVPITADVNAVNGVATFNLSADALIPAGTYTVTATSSGLTSATAVTTVVALRTVISGVAATLPSGSNLGTVTVSLDDASGNLVASSTLPVTLTITGPYGYSQTQSVNAVGGVATFNLSSLTLVNIGNYTVTASGMGLVTSSAATMVNALPSNITLGLSTASAAPGTPIVLTATATSGDPLYPGQVNFIYTQTLNGVTLTGSFGMGQLTSNGTSTVTIQPGVGTYLISASYAGTRTTAPAVSTSQTLTVAGTPPYPTLSGIVATGNPGNYTLTGTVSQTGLLPAPTGTVSFLNTTDANQSIATGTINPSTLTYSAQPAINSPMLHPNAVVVVTGDFNGDGITDLVTLSSTTVSVQLGSGNGVFQAATSYDLGATTTSVVLADVNNDGNLDIVVAAQYGYWVEILLGDGTGNFIAPPSGSQIVGVEDPSTLAVVDLNHDGNMDIITADPAAGSVNVMLGNGDGSFQGPVGYGASGGYPTSVALGDFNGDGSPDLAVSNSGGNIGILLSNGDGTFQTATTLTSLSNGGNLATGSLRANGKVDLIADTGQGFQVYLGNNDGTFAAPVQYSTAYGLQDSTLADINHDGKLDFVALSYGPAYVGQMVVMNGKGDGTFSAEADVSIGAVGPGNFALADVNNDGQTDFLAANYSAGSVSILLGLQTVSAQATGIAVPGPSAGTAYVEASYPGDAVNAPSVSSTVPLVVAPSTTVLSSTPYAAPAGTPITLTATIGSVVPANAGTVAFYAGSTLVATVNVANGSASYTTSSLPAGATTFYAVFSGSAALATSTSANYNVYVASTSTTSLSLSTLTAVANTPVILTATTLQGADAVMPGQVTFNYQQTVNGIMLNGTFGTVQLNSLGAAVLTVQPGAGTFIITAQFSGTLGAAPSNSAPQTLTVTAAALLPTNSSLVATGTIGNYTLADSLSAFGAAYPTGTISFLNTSASNAAVATAAIDPSNSAYGLVASSTPPAANAAVFYVATGDVNGDGIADLVTLGGDSPSTLQVQLGLGNGAFSAPTTFTLDEGYPASIAIADVNGDGRADILVTNQSANSLVILLGDGTGNFTVPALTPGPQYLVTGNNPYQVVVADLNHDGNPDLLVTNIGDNNIGVFLGNGDGSFQSQVLYPAGTAPNSLVVADFNHDGVPDVAVATYGGAIVVFLGNGDGTLRANGTLTPAQPDPTTSITAGSLRGNGVLDLVVASNYGTNFEVFPGNNDGTFATPVLHTSTIGVAQVLLVDTNNDGKLDVVGMGGLETAPYTGYINIFAGKGDGTFAAEKDVEVDGNMDNFVAADVNNDGLVDFVFSNYAISAPVFLGQWSTTATATGVYVTGTGTQNVDASYPGDATHAASLSATVPLSPAGQDANSTVLTVSSISITAGSSIALTATVSPLATLPPEAFRGTVSFYDGETLLGTANVGVNGVATYTTAGLPTGSDPLSAVFSGNVVSAMSTSATVTVTVTAGLRTSTVLSSSTKTPVYGQSFTLTATVSPAPTGSPLGIVSFYAGATLLGTSSLNANGVAALAVGSLAAGSNAITASYAGNVGSIASTSAVLTLVVSKATTSTVVTSSSLAPVFGQSVILTATVKPASTDTTRGTVTFYGGTTSLGTSPVDAGGIASLAGAVLPIGTDAVTAVYSGSANFATSTSAAITASARAQTAVAFTASLTTQLYDNPITFMAKVNSATPGVLGGTVSFFDGTTLVGTSPVANGASVFTSSTLADGMHSLSAVYSGDSDFLTSMSTGAPITITVGDLNLALGGDNNKTVVPGQAVTYNFPLSPLVTPTFIYDVTLTATGLPPGATYSFLPAVIPAGSGTLPVALTIQTAPITARNAPPAGGSQIPRWTALALGLLLPLAGVKRFRSRLTGSAGLLALLVFSLMTLGLAMGVSGCGAGGFFGDPLAGQSFTITVHAKSADLSRSSTVQLNFK